MHYETFGNRNNPAVVFLHGWGGSGVSWGNIPQVIAGFGFFVVIVDFWGFGKSKLPPRPFSVGDFADSVLEIIKKLGLQNVSLIGHSFGGRVAIKIAGNNYCWLKNLILVDSAGIVPRRTISYKFKVYRYKRLKSRVQKGEVDPSVLEKFGSVDYKVLCPVMKESFVKIVNEDLKKNAKQISCETLIVWGRSDKDTPLYMAKKLKRVIKESELIILDGGHFCYLENKNKFIDLIYDFLTS